MGERERRKSSRARLSHYRSRRGLTPNAPRQWDASEAPSLFLTHWHPGPFCPHTTPHASESFGRMGMALVVSQGEWTAHPRQLCTGERLAQRG